MKTNLVPAALAAILALAFATLAQSQESSGIKSTVENDAKAVGHAVADGAHDVADKSKEAAKAIKSGAHDVADKSREAGHAIAGETKTAGGAIRDDSKKAVTGKKADEPEPKN
jgi:hypothetical protein